MIFALIPLLSFIIFIKDAFSSSYKAEVGFWFLGTRAKLPSKHTPAVVGERWWFCSFSQ